MQAHYLRNGKLVLRPAATTTGALPYNGYGKPPVSK